MCMCPVRLSDQELLEEFERMLNEVEYDDVELYLNRSKLPMIKLCQHSNKRKAIISKTLKYWYCPDCKKDVGDL